MDTADSKIIKFKKKWMSMFNFGFSTHLQIKTQIWKKLYKVKWSKDLHCGVFVQKKQLLHTTKADILCSYGKEQFQQY